MSTISLSDKFASLDSQNKWDGVDLIIAETHKHQTCNSYTCGPFIICTNVDSGTPVIIIFVPSFSLTQIPNPRKPSAFLKHLVDQDFMHIMVFSSLEALESFKSYFSTAANSFQSFCANISPYDFKCCFSVISIFPNQAFPQQCKATLDIKDEKAFLSIISATDPSSKFEIGVNDKPFLSCSTSVPTTLGPITMAPNCFTVGASGKSKDTRVICLCKNIGELFIFIASTFLLTLRHATIGPAPSKEELEAPKKQHKHHHHDTPAEPQKPQENKPIETQKIEQPKIAQKTETTKSEPKAESPKQEPPKIEAIPTEPPKPAPQIVIESLEPEAPKPEKVAPPKKEEEKIEQPKIEVKKAYEPAHILAEKLKSLEEELKKLKMPEKVELPTLEEVIRSTEKAPIQYNEATAATEISSALQFLPDNSEKIFSPYVEFSDSSAESLVKETISKISGPSDADFNEFFKFSEFVPHSFSEFTSSSSPSCSLLTEFMALNEEINISGIKSIDESNVGERIAILVSSVLLNGISNSDEDNAEFVSSFEEFKNSVQGLSNVLQKVNRDDKLYDQVAEFSIELLNAHLLIPLITETCKSDTWVSKHYLISAFLSAESEVEMLLALLGPLMVNHTFLLRNNLLKDSTDILKASTTPSFLYKELGLLCSKAGSDGCEESIVRAVARQLKSNLRKKTQFGRSGESQAWQFFDDVLDGQKPSGKYDEWEEFVAAINDAKQAKVEGLKNIMNEKEVKLEKLLSEGVKRRKIHIWMLFLAVHHQEVDKWYQEDSTLSDFFKANKAVNSLFHIMKLLGPPAK